jgi:Na+-driven multidrug efflux pump
LVPDYGIVGAAIATSITMTIGGLLGFLEIFFLYKMQPFSQNTAKFVFIGTVTGLVFFFINRWLMVDNVIFLFMSILVMAGFYLLGLVLAGTLDELDREIIQNIYQRIQNGIRK